MNIDQDRMVAETSVEYSVGLVIPTKTEKPAEAVKNREMVLA